MKQHADLKAQLERRRRNKKRQQEDILGDLMGDTKSEKKKRKKEKSSIDKELDELLTRDQKGGEFSGLESLMHDGDSSIYPARDIDQEEAEHRRYYQEQLKKEQE